jgi:hypothetical protein
LDFFKRLRGFVAQAAECSIVVEVCFFNSQYKDTWPISLLFHKNKVQGEGNCDINDAQSSVPCMAVTEPEQLMNPCISSKAFFWSSPLNFVQTRM